MKKFTFRRKILLGICLIVLACIPYSNQAQSVKRQCIPVYSATTMTGDAAFMQTAGQPYNTLSSSGNANAVLQGFQQPVILSVESIDNVPAHELNVIVFPNPAAYAVILQSNEPVENSLVRITDMNGRIIFSEKVPRLSIYEINCGGWGNGLYLITISDMDKTVSTYKLTINK